jgi:hypothetical protein
MALRVSAAADLSQGVHELRSNRIVHSVSRQTATGNQTKASLPTAMPAVGFGKEHVLLLRLEQCAELGKNAVLPGSSKKAR